MDKYRHFQRQDPGHAFETMVHKVEDISEVMFCGHCDWNHNKEGLSTVGLSYWEEKCFQEGEFWCCKGQEQGDWGEEKDKK